MWLSIWNGVVKRKRKKKEKKKRIKIECNGDKKICVVKKKEK